MRSKLLIIFLIISSVGYSQTETTNTQKSQSPKTSYVIGIGNPESLFFQNVLEFVQNDESLVVYAICEQHHAIGINIPSGGNKDYSSIKDLLITEFPNIKLFEKDASIFSNDCKNEILKQ